MGFPSVGDYNNTNLEIGHKGVYLMNNGMIANVNIEDKTVVGVRKSQQYGNPDIHRLN